MTHSKQNNNGRLARSQITLAALSTLWMAAVLCSGTVLAATPDSQLLQAVRSGDADAVAASLEGGADVDATTADGGSVLLWAVHSNQQALVETLLEAGANVAIHNRYGVGPASLAAENGNGTIIELLLKAGVDPNLAQPGGETLLMTAARTGAPGAVRRSWA